MTAPTESERADAMRFAEKLAGGDVMVSGWDGVRLGGVLLAMLSDPRLPPVEEVSEEFLHKWYLQTRCDYGPIAQMREYYRALRAELVKPPKPKMKTVWRVRMKGGQHDWSCSASSLSDARQRAIFYISYDGATHVSIEEEEVPA